MLSGLKNQLYIVYMYIFNIYLSIEVHTHVHTYWDKMKNKIQHKKYVRNM